MNWWGGVVLFQSKDYVISQTFWIECRPAWMAWVAVHQNILQTKCFLAYVYGLLSHRYWTEFNNPPTLCVNFCSSIMLFYYSALECFSVPRHIPPNLPASTSLSQSHGHCLQPLGCGWIPCFLLPEHLEFLFNGIVTHITTWLSRKLFLKMYTLWGRTNLQLYLIVNKDYELSPFRLTRDTQPRGSSGCFGIWPQKTRVTVGARKTASPWAPSCCYLWSII